MNIIDNNIISYHIDINHQDDIIDNISYDIIKPNDRIFITNVGSNKKYVYNIKTVIDLYNKKYFKDPFININFPQYILKYISYEVSIFDIKNNLYILFNNINNIINNKDYISDNILFFNANIKTLNQIIIQYINYLQLNNKLYIPDNDQLNIINNYNKIYNTIFNDFDKLIDMYKSNITSSYLLTTYNISNNSLNLLVDSDVVKIDLIDDIKINSPIFNIKFFKNMLYNNILFKSKNCVFINLNILQKIFDNHNKKHMFFDITNICWNGFLSLINMKYISIKYNFHRNFNKIIFPSDIDILDITNSSSIDTDINLPLHVNKLILTNFIFSHFDNMPNECNELILDNCFIDNIILILNLMTDDKLYYRKVIIKSYTSLLDDLINEDKKYLEKINNKYIIKIENNSTIFDLKPNMDPLWYNSHNYF